MIICPECGGTTEYNLYFSAYQCLQNDCRYYKSKYDLTDEDKIYFNRQEGYDRWELDEPVKDCEFVDGTDLIDIFWKDGSYQCISKYNLLKVILKVVKKEIKPLK